MNRNRTGDMDTPDPKHSKDDAGLTWLGSSFQTLHAVQLTTSIFYTVAIMLKFGVH